MVRQPGFRQRVFSLFFAVFFTVVSPAQRSPPGGAQKSSSKVLSGSRPHHSSGAAPNSWAFARRARVRRRHRVGTGSLRGERLFTPMRCASVRLLSVLLLGIRRVRSSVFLNEGAAKLRHEGTQGGGAAPRVMGTSVESPTVNWAAQSRRTRRVPDHRCVR